MRRRRERRRTNIVWITGATSGIGEALARTCPWPDTEIISVSRREHPDLETVLLRPHRHGVVGRASASTSPSGWRRSAASARVFIHNALYYWGGAAYMGEGDPANHRDEIIANVVAPLVLGDMFIRAAAARGRRRRRRRPGADLVGVGAHRVPRARDLRRVEGGDGAVGARVRAEREDRGKGPWVSAIRPGFVDTPGRAPRSRAPARHAPRRRRHRRGGPHRQHARPPTSRPRTSGTRSPTTASRSRCCSSASPSASPPDASMPT